VSIINELKRRNVIRVGIAYVLFGWVVLQGADFALDLIGAPNWVIQALTIAVAAGLPLTLIFAWAFELTPEGIKREKDVDRSQSITSHTGRKLDRVIIGVLALAVVYLLVDRLFLQDLFSTNQDTPDTAAAVEPALPSVAQGPSVAVLPFINMSGDRENEYFSDGLTETLLHMLSQLPGLRVAARTSSFAFKGQNASIAEIAGTLGVEHVLEGSVQKADDRVRVTAQLIRTNDGFHVWSQNYTRPLEDIFAIQDEIATDVADALGTSLLGAANPDLQGVSTKDLSAYDSYLKGLEQQAIYSYTSLDAAEDHFEQALARDPGFTEARLSLARNYLLQFSTGLIDIDETRTATGPLLLKVREQEPDNRLARALELVLEQMDFKPSDSMQEVKAAVDELLVLLQDLPTESFLRTVVATALVQLYGNEQQAIELLQAGLLIDPLEAELHRQLGYLYAGSGNLAQARASMQRTLELVPDNPNNYIAMSDLEKEFDNLPSALDWLRQATLVDREDHEIAAKLARNLYHLRLPEEGDYWLARVQVLAPGSGLARSLEVDRAVAREDKEQVIELASAVIAGQVDDRQNAYSDSLYHYIDTMMRDDRAKEAYDFLASVRPEITQYDQVPSDFIGLSTQWASIAVMSGFETFENRKAAWNEFTGRLDELGFPWKKVPESGNYTWNYVINGEVEQAVDHVLSHELTEPVSKNPGLHRKPLYALFAPVYEDQRVAAKLIERGKRFAELREDVRTMLQKPEWNNP
jgi:TolB-like protein/tetratricopeptide (TPR) repeat protein